MARPIRTELGKADVGPRSLKSGSDCWAGALEAPVVSFPRDNKTSYLHLIASFLPGGVCKVFARSQPLEGHTLLCLGAT